MNKTRILLGLALSLFFFHGSAKAQQTCKAEEFAATVYYAQGLDPKAEALGKKMLACANRDYRESSLFWLSFYYGMTNQRPKISGLATLMPRQVLNDPKLIAQEAALKGNNTLLNDRVESGQMGFADDAWMLVTLARSQMITEQFKPAILNYNRVLKIREKQDSIEIEQLYSLIWAKDREAALTKLAILKRYEPESYMRQSLERAERLLKETNQEPEKLHDLLSIAYLQERDNRGYAALGGRIDYHGPVTVEIEALEHTLPLEHEKENVASITVGRHWGKEDGFGLVTDIGYYSAGEDNVTGLLAAHYHYGHNFAGGLGLRRKEVSAFERPPHGERAGLMRDSFLWNIGLYDRVFASGALHQEDEVMFEDYAFELRFGELLKEETDSGFGLIVPVSYRHRPMASPDYRSFPHDIRVGLGVRMGISDGRKFFARTEAVLESIHRDDYGAVDSYEKLLGGRIKADLRYYFLDTYYNFFEGSAFVIEKMPGERSDDKGSEFLVGIGISQERH